MNIAPGIKPDFIAKRDATFIRFFESRDHADDRRLPAAGGSDYRQEFIIGAVQSKLQIKVPKLFFDIDFYFHIKPPTG
jgi:hypothetical protein